MFDALRRVRAASAGILLAVALVAGNLVALVGSNVAATPAVADTAPVDPNLPETVTAAALPTVQINGVVYSQVIVGNRVYVTGRFTQARPAGAAAGTNQTARSNVLAYNLTTGALITDWAPSLNGQGRAITASTDGSRIFVGGDFTSVSNTARNRFVALDAQTGTVIAGINPAANTRVDSLAISDTTVYVGGHFTVFGGQPRARLAAIDVATGALRSWAPSVDREVVSMVFHSGTNRVIVGGSFNTLNGQTHLGMGSVDAVSGAAMPWAVNQIIRNNAEGAEIAGLVTEGDSVFGVGWSYSPQGANANFEGAFSADAATGALQWMIGGRGDNYAVAVTNGVVYTAGHPHDWGMVDWNPETPTRSYQYAHAIDARRSPTLTNAYGVGNNWNVVAGRPAAQPLHWLPSFSLGNFTGQYQAVWSVAANDDYVVYGGEFPRINGMNQQGLVRFAKRGISPTVDAVQGSFTPTATALGNGTVRLAWTAPWDRDNQRLTFEVQRGGVTIKTFTNDATWWNRAPLGFVDTTAPPGSSQTYRVRVTDPFGNGFTSGQTTITIPTGPAPPSQYEATVKADNPEWLWRMNETSGTTARDRQGSNDLTLNSAVVRNAPGALLNESNPSADFPGSTSTSTVQAATPYWQSGPQTFSLEAWVNTTTTTGGKIIGFGSSRTGRSSDNGNDRTIYMTNSGQLRFGVRPDMGTRQTIVSPSSYRDGGWHHVVGTLGTDGLKLYVDGALVASNSSVTKAQVYRGYWRVGGDNLGSWPSAPTREAIDAQLDEVAVYPGVLTPGQVEAHYAASGRGEVGPNVDPVASFTSSSQNNTATLTSTSTDGDGAITSTTWSFGDSTTGSGSPTSHSYSAGGTYPVTLTVTDNRGGVDSITQYVTVTDPPPNIPPVASFTSSVSNLTANLTSTAMDPDGTITARSWSFGDSTANGSGTSVSHTYANPGTYPVTLTVTDNRGGVDSITQNVTVTDPPPTPTAFATDLFGRTVTGGFGTADLGGAWTYNGTLSRFSVNGSGRIAGGVGTNVAAYLPSVSQRDIDVTADISIDRAASGSGAYVSILGRRLSENNDYRLRVRYQSNGTLVAYVVRVVNNADTILAWANVAGINPTPGEVLRVRFQVSGGATTTARAKVWRANAAQPAAWLISGNDAAPAAFQNPGNIGILLYHSSSWAGTAGTLTIDNLNVGPIG